MDELFHETFRRRSYAVLALAVVTPLGFACKAFDGPGGWWFRNHGAGLLYEVFWILVAFLVLPTRRAARVIPPAVFCATAILEFLQLSRTPVLQAVRSHPWGRMLIGTTFAWWDIPHYAAGCALGGLLLGWVLRVSGRGGRGGVSTGPKD